MRSEDEHADGLSSSYLGSWSTKSSDEVENFFEVQEVPMSDASLILQSEGS